MHDGCSGSFDNGEQVVDKIRMMGFSEQFLPVPFDIPCHHCKKEFEMETFETACPHCGHIHAVTPCHAFDADNIVSVKAGY